MPLADATARGVLEWIGVELDRPLITQVSRFDPWKDPPGVIAAYRLAREKVPALQLALVGSMALDDPEGWGVYRQDTPVVAGNAGGIPLQMADGDWGVLVQTVEQCAKAVVALLGLVESYGYGWYVALIWVPLYNVLSARALAGVIDRRSALP